MIIPEEWSEVLIWLKEAAEGYEDFKSWLQHMESGREEITKHMKEKKQNKDGIHLMTMHAAKGLEFDTVYVLHLNDGTIPKLKRGEKVIEEHVEEERRLFYVALTRAKIAVELHYVTGTKENPRLKSRFLEDIRDL
jgi:DNA helicase-2/ATP-dependent DNA helicase PcrA